jgi:diaminopimelate decarboxylase
VKAWCGYSEGELHADGVPLAAIAAAFGTPCYVYSRRDLEARFTAFRDAFTARAVICYAVKANSNLAVLQTLARAGAGFDIVSVGELRRVLAAGGDPGKTVFAGACKLAHELEEALRAGIRCFNVESEAELEALAAIAADLRITAPVALRVNPDVAAGAHPHIATGLKEHKFGIPVERARALYERIGEHPWLAAHGVACHIGSQIMDIAPLAEAAGRVAELASELLAAGHPLVSLDLGGGLGIDTPEQPAPAPTELARALEAATADLGLELVIEPGRAIVGPAGLLLTRVAYTKAGDGREFALVDAAMNDLLRPALYGAWHDILAVSPRGDPRPMDVVGPVCESADFLGKDRRLAVTAGSLLAVADAGAYGFTMSSNYNSRPRCAEVMIDAGEPRLVRARETFDDLTRGERLLP